MAVASTTQRVERYAALGDPVRLSIVDELLTSDRAPVELSTRLGLESNLLAHHLDILDGAGLITRSHSSGDGRRRYVRLHRRALGELSFVSSPTTEEALFVCTANSARSQLAAALWTQLTGARASSAGTHPARRVHPRAVAAAVRAGLDLSRAHPTNLDSVVNPPELVVTVCDRAHEELGAHASRWHWSIPDPVGSSSRTAFDDCLDELRERITSVAQLSQGVS